MPNCRAIGWTDEVATWLTAADVLVDSAGGTTCWEALVAHRPVVLHRPLAGHGRLNATTLQQAGLARVTWTAAELVAGVAAAADRDLRVAAAVPAAAADAADLVLTAA
jgi:UDP-N-acetylglucosamine:LPS N-acetylglucosamine transferase